MSLPEDDASDSPEAVPEQGAPSSEPLSEGRALAATDDDDDEEDDHESVAENLTIQRIVELLPPEDRAQLFSVIRRESSSHRGWLPTPTFMREYEEVLPGLAERIVAMPEREQTFRHANVTNVIDRDYRLRSTGQWMGLVALMLILAFCAFLVVDGHAKEAAWVAGTVIVGAVGVFVTGQMIGGSSSSKDEAE